MSRVLILLMLVTFVAASVSAQTADDLKRYFEGRNVTLKIDMPATKDGVNVYPERPQPLNYSEYANRLKHHGTYNTSRVKPGVLYVGPRTTYLKEGLTTQEVLQLLGGPAAISKHTENGLTATTYEFPRGEGRVLIAEFVNGALVRSRTETRFAGEQARLNY